MSVNDALFHVGRHDPPFGGAGASGMGHLHGKEGFDSFSKVHPVFHQARFASLKFRKPPYASSPTLCCASLLLKACIACVGTRTALATAR